MGRREALMPTLTLTISPQVLVCLCYLARRGLYGGSETEAATRILEGKLEEMIADGVIPRKVLAPRRPRPSKRSRPKE